MIPADLLEVLGQAEIGVTMNTYAHVLPMLRQEAAVASVTRVAALVTRLFGVSITTCAARSRPT
jgi:hypothetical protein